MCPGGRLPGVTVTATNVATNVASTTVTQHATAVHDSRISRRATTRSTVELAGFKKIARDGIEVRIGDRLDA